MLSTTTSGRAPSNDEIVVLWGIPARYLLKARSNRRLHCDAAGWPSLRHRFSQGRSKGRAGWTCGGHGSFFGSGVIGFHLSLSYNIETLQDRPQGPPDYCALLLLR